MLRIVLAGICGKMGRAVGRQLIEEDDFEIVGGVDINFVGEDIGNILNLKPMGIYVHNDLETVLKETNPDVLLDFTNPKVVMSNIEIALKNGINAVIGTTGITEEDVPKIEELSREKGASIIIAPNFSIGALLLMKFAAEAAKYFPDVEIIEYHHDQKLDSPSGTAIKTAELILKNNDIKSTPTGEFEKIPGARGGNLGGIKIHSVRLPGFLAHQEVILGSKGQVLTLRHDSLTRESFFYGINYALRKIKSIKGVVYGLENILD
jgi:4-hydroxy-tetrahydrodipicolinate reductase